MSNEKYTIRLTSETGDRLRAIANYENTKNKFENIPMPEITEEDIIKAALAYFLDVMDSNRDVLKNLLITTKDARPYKFRNRFKQIMKQRNIKQVQLAEKTEIPKSNLSEILNNKYTPSLDYFFRIWIALDCPPLEEVLYREFLKD